MQKGSVEVAYECCQQQEHSVLCHEGLWQPCPSEAIVHVIEDAFFAASVNFVIFSLN